jgi:hypothetical protein
MVGKMSDLVPIEILKFKIEFKFLSLIPISAKRIGSRIEQHDINHRAKTLRQMVHLSFAEIKMKKLSGWFDKITLADL